MCLVDVSCGEIWEPKKKYFVLVGLYSVLFLTDGDDDVPFKYFIMLYHALLTG